LGSEQKLGATGEIISLALAGGFYSDPEPDPELLDHVNQLLRLLDGNKKRRRERDD
jgi:hypothetical protein